MDEYSFFELRLVGSLMAKLPVADIANILERSAEDVELLISDLALCNHVVPFHVVERKKVVELEQENLKKKREFDRQKEVRRQQKQQQESLKELATGRRSAYVLPKRQEKVLETKAHDWSQMVAIRIDPRTTIFAKPGEDPELCKQRYLQKLEDSKPKARNRGYVEVKKFKPVK